MAMQVLLPWAQRLGMDAWDHLMAALEDLSERQNMSLRRHLNSERHDSRTELLRRRQRNNVHHLLELLHQVGQELEQ